MKQSLLEASSATTSVEQALQFSSGRSKSSVHSFAPLVVTCILVLISTVALVLELLVPRPIQAAGLQFDRMTALFSLLVSIVGAVVVHFSRNYLNGDPEQSLFLKRLTTTIIFAYILMISNNLIVLFGAWSLTSWGLHTLLIHYRHRPQAIRVARKKFLVSRIGDVALAGVIAVCWFNFHTVELSHLLPASSLSPSNHALSAIAFLAAIAALTKSAQFPFHCWLPETLEAPTPVSAIMHAGIINGGGVLLLKFAPEIVHSTAALLLLTIAGSATTIIGQLSKWAQITVKRGLAWSTVAQMGFMTFECGLGAFAAATLHIVGHGFYKAYSFLRAGSLPNSPPASAFPEPAKALALVAAGTITASGTFGILITQFDRAVIDSPGEWALLAVAALAIGQIWVPVLHSTPHKAPIYRVGSAAVITVIWCIAALWLNQLMTIYLTPVIGNAQLPNTTVNRLICIIPVLSIVTLCVAFALLPFAEQNDAGRRFKVHASNGFYLSTIMDQIVAALWISQIND